MKENGRVKLSELKPNERNPRRISDAAFKALCKSIKRDPVFMELRPIVVDKDMNIVGGNQRYRACVELGMKEVPPSWVMVRTDLTPEQRRRFVLIDNSPDGASGYWDYAILQQDYKLPELERLGFTFAQKVDMEEEWKGMPEFVQEKFRGYKQIIVRFLKKKDFTAFAALIEQKLTPNTNSIWFPKRDQDQMGRDVEYDEE